MSYAELLDGIMGPPILASKAEKEFFSLKNFDKATRQAFTNLWQAGVEPDVLSRVLMRLAYLEGQRSWRKRLKLEQTLRAIEKVSAGIRDTLGSGAVLFKEGLDALE